MTLWSQVEGGAAAAPTRWVGSADEEWTGVWAAVATADRADDDDALEALVRRWRLCERCEMERGRCGQECGLCRVAQQWAALRKCGMVGKKFEQERGEV